MAEAVGTLPSFAYAAYALGVARIQVSPRHLGRIAAELGGEMTRSRDEKVNKRRQRQLPARVAKAPEAVAVEVDGGRLRTREAGSQGVHQAEYREEKIACLVNLPGEAPGQDPQPEPPESFLLPRRVQRLVARIKGGAGQQPDEGEPGAPAATAAEADPAGPSRPGVSKGGRVRTCVASLACSREFGPMVAAEARERNFYGASRRAFVADGQEYNWTIHRGYFPDFEPIADLLHVLCYLYLAARAALAEEKESWALYARWLRECWQGRARGVIEELEVWQGRIGEPPQEGQADEKDPRRVVATARGYLGNNEARMDYPRYRLAGLPVTSSLVESLVGEFNARVKARGKFWNRPEGAEPILQLRAAVLSEDDRLSRHFEQRPGCAFRRRAA